MNPQEGPHLMPPCKKCAAPQGAHSLRCPTVNLRPGWLAREGWEDSTREAAYWREQAE